ncbi:MAG: sodium:calcium antiporter [Chloroflexi bacterium]|nr:MAG: sodium:calcium antiporter [Chloroflexota bacterium]
MDTLTLVLFILGFFLLIGGAELLVRGASSLALAVGISPLVVGLTVVAYGTSAPELAVTINASFAGEADLALGNVVGSNISNILLVLGLSAAVASLVVNQQLVRLEVPLMIGLAVLVFLMGLDGKIGQIDGAIFVLGAISYTVFVIRKSRKETKAIEAQYAEAVDKKPKPKKSPLQFLLQVGFILAGLALLVAGADWLIGGATAIAEIFGVSQLVIGLTIVAVGTSLPEIATSVIASFKGQRDIAVGNAIGSNIFNILLVLGVTALVAPGGIPIPRTAITFDIPVMIAVSVAALPIFFTDYRIDRWEGFLFLGYYLAYTAYLYLRATDSSALDEFGWAMILFVIPLTIITLIILTVKAARKNGRPQTILADQ